MNSKKLVIFDLDGTLLNSIADLTISTNYALHQLGYTIQYDEEAILKKVGNGLLKLAERALPNNMQDEAHIKEMYAEFMKHYDTHNNIKSSLYPGIIEMLETLQKQKIALAVASNKYQKGTEDLMHFYCPTIKFAAILGQRDGIPKKPDPQIVYDAMNLAGIKNKNEVLYIGDSDVDMKTAIAAHVDACAVTWGFRARNLLEQFHPKHICSSPQEILPIVLPIEKK